MGEETKTMHKDLKAFFSECKTPKHACRRRVHDQLAPVVQLAAATQMQVLEYRRLITTATLSADHDAELDGKLEHIHQTFAAMERESLALSVSARELSKIMQQLDRYLSSAEGEIQTWAAAKAASQPLVEPVELSTTP